MPWDENAGGVGSTLAAYEHSGATVAAGATGGATGGAIGGAGTGAAYGGVSGAIVTGGPGAVLGAVAGAGAGAIAGGITGAFHGAFYADGVEDAFRGTLGPGAVSGILPGVGGAFAKLSGGAGAAGGLALAGGGVAVGVGASVGGGAAIGAGVASGGCYLASNPIAPSGGSSRDPEVLQRGGHTLSDRTRKTLGLTKDQAKRAIERLKEDVGQGNASHNHNILSNGDVLDSDTGRYIGNLFNGL